MDVSSFLIKSDMLFVKGKKRDFIKKNQIYCL